MPDTPIKMTDSEIQARMGWTTCRSCANCDHLTEHPDSYKGGEINPTMQCSANVIHPFIVKEPLLHVCKFYSKVTK